MAKSEHEKDKIRELLPYIKDMISVLSVMSVDAAELELSNNVRSISRQIRDMLILEGKSKQYRKLLTSIRLSIKDGKSSRKSKPDEDQPESDQG